MHRIARKQTPTIVVYSALGVRRCVGGQKIFYDHICMVTTNKSVDKNHLKQKAWVKILNTVAPVAPSQTVYTYVRPSPS